ncbi:MAG: 1-acyl-sn-glycerol-3-phosphate acyltransferase [Gammaproteobacteria bacterium]|nr:1-acyl-sn-glycerol-3-phosphate acyltransferase [Gammaproteobacteria bacterium]
MITGVWRWFCQIVVNVFYRHYEVDGIENLTESRPVLLCANHANALADAVILQAVSSRLIHPLARSGLFKNPFLWPILQLIQAVPIFRRQDEGADTSRNQDSFSRCYDFFKRGEVLLIFPEGQSHSDPGLRPLKTGAARMALGARQAGVEPLVIPVGLNFSSKGQFRSTVFIKFGTPINTMVDATQTEEEQARQLTSAIYAGLDAVTLNAQSHEELDFIKTIERFFAMRHGKYRQRSLELRFRAMKKLAQAQQQLQHRYPEKIALLKQRLANFDRLCRHWDIRDYHLTVKYRPTLITRFILRSLFILLVVLPVGAWGIINSFIPFMLTRWIAHRVSRDTDQYDTAKMVFGLAFFSLCWGGQIWYSHELYGQTTALIYGLSLIPGAAAGIMLRNERQRILENLRVFFLFVRKRKLRQYLEQRRERLERDLAELVRLAKQKSPLS